MIKSAAPKAAFDWWALSLRGLAVLVGLSVLLIGTPTDRGGPARASAPLLLLLFPALDPKLADVFRRIVNVKPPFDVQLRLWRGR